MSRIFNFSAGPATLPEEVLVQAGAELHDFQGSGMSLMEMSHRGKIYSAVHMEAMDNIRRLMKLSDDYAVLFLQGGATGQFAMLAANFLSEGRTADYLNCGAWSTKAIKEAKAMGTVHVAGDTAKDIPTRMADPESLQFSENPVYVHLCSNETISGAQYKSFPDVPAPLMADMSSDILSRPLDYSRFAMVYAGAQKNLGPSGVTLVVIRKEWAEQGSRSIPGIWQYRNHIDNDSMLNTPPCYGIYILNLVTRWVLANGGIEAMDKVNRRKAAKLYAAIDAGSFYRGTAETAYRSDMNVTYRLPSEDLEARFVKEAEAAGLSGLKGHRSVGGIRASIYNAMPEAGVDALIAFMQEFERVNG